jgi:hypothetical protein
MSQGALCPDETAFHIERTLKLPGKWLDGLNKEVPEHTLELLKNPDRAGLQDDEDPEDGFATSTTVEPAPMAVSTKGAETAQAAAGPAVDAAQVLAGPESLQAAGKRAAKASRRATAITEVQLPLSEIAPPSQSGPNGTSSMASPELRKQNLTLLLQGKGAKSALARVLHAKPPYVSAMLSGRKSLDKELCNGMARALGLPDNWFEAPRTAADIPAATLQRLAPLRDAAANADTAADSDAGEVAPAPTAASGTSAAGTAAEAASNELSIARAGTAKQTRRRTRSASQRGHQQLLEPTDLVEESPIAPVAAPAQADLPAPVELEAQPATQEPAPALHTEVVAPVLDAAPVAAAASTHRAALQAIDFMPVLSQPLVIEGGLAPITEALIKILVLKAKQGALSEDKAFDLLGAVRLL